MHHFNHVEALLRRLDAPRRNRFFYAKRMDVQHFEMEQAYGKLKQWLLNRLTLGKGVLCGLKVAVDGDRLCVEPGVAIDGLGREIIVPVRMCIDPRLEDECCSGHGATPEPDHEPGRESGDPRERRRDGEFTLWVCYRECLADFQPVLASTCDTREQCAPGTIVETFCLKVTDGLAPLQGDPEWCTHLWPAPGQWPNEHLWGGPGGTPVEDLRAAVASRRHLLCGMLDATCEPDRGDPCVPIAAGVLRDGRITALETCLVRPRVYSNAVLLDLILCLADKIDECCNDHPAPAELLRVRRVDFLRREGDGTEAPVTGVLDARQETRIDIARKVNAIRIRFNRPFAQDAHAPSTHAFNDPDYKRHNLQILPERPLRRLPYVPGTLHVEAPDTIRFDLFPDSPYVISGRGWQKGRYSLILYGTDDAARGRPALQDLSGTALDGDKIAPAAGFLSGNGSAGGDFIADFVIDEEEQPAADTMRVRRVEFLRRNEAGGEEVLARMETARDRTEVPGRMDAIRIVLSKPLSQSAAHRPTTHGLDDPDFERHNVRVLIEPEQADQIGARFVPGTISRESDDTLRFDVTRDTRVVDREGRWRLDPTLCSLHLRGTAVPASGWRPLADADGNELDGEPIEPTGGVLSGDGGPGGDFVARFVVTHGA